MEYVNLGSTGLRVSRVCLGMMSFGSHESREWALDESAAEPIVRRAVEGGIIFFDTADVYNGGQSEILTGRILRKLFGTREEYVVATKVHGRTMPGENGRGLSRSTSSPRSTPRSSASSSTTWTSTRSIAGTRRRPSRRRWKRSTTSSAGKARYIGASSMFAWQFAKAHASRAHALRLDAEPLQPDLPGGRAGDDPLCLDLGVGVLPWSPLARGLLAGSRTASGEQLTQRARSRSLHRRALPTGSRRPGHRACRRDRGRPGSPAGAARAGVASPQARSDGADRRRDEAGARRGRAGRGVVVA